MPDNFGHPSYDPRSDIREMQERLNEIMKKVVATTPPPHMVLTYEDPAVIWNAEPPLLPERVVLLKRDAVDRGFAAVYDYVLERFDDPEDRYRQFYKRGLIDAIKDRGRFGS